MPCIVLAANAEADQPWVADAAAQLAQQLDAEVEIVSVDELETEMLSTVPREVLVERARQAADRALQRVTEQGVTASASVRSGTALEQIIAFAHERDAEMIVVGASTRNPLAARLLGSVPIGLMRRARRPVLVIAKPDSNR